MSAKTFFQNFVLSLVARLWRILRTSWASTNHAPCNCKQQFPPAFGRHRRLSRKAPTFTSWPRLCGEEAQQHFKIHIFYSWGVTATRCLWSFLWLETTILFISLGTFLCPRFCVTVTSTNSLSGVLWSNKHLKDDACATPCHANADNLQTCLDNVKFRPVRLKILVWPFLGKTTM